MGLHELAREQKAIILKIDHMEKEAMIRVMEMGLIQGAEVKLVGKGPFADPLCIYVKGAYVCLRHEEDRLVSVRPLVV